MLTLRIKAGNIDEAARELFKRILRDSGEDAIFLRKKGEGAFFPPALITDAETAGKVGVLLPPLMVDNAACGLSYILRKDSVEQSTQLRIVAFLRPCEARAFVELTKLKQGSLNSVLLITPLCPGALSLEEFRKNEKISTEELFSLDSSRKRDSCRICAYPIAPFSDIQILFERDGLVLVAQTEKGRVLLLSLGAQEENINLDSEKAKFVESRQKAREEFLVQMKRRLEGSKGLREFLADCVNCHNCMRLCPVCYCRLCFFESADVEADVNHHLAIARRDGYRSLDDEKLLFHLGRLEHMAVLCVNCGVCSDACPNEVGVFGMFALVSDSVQKMFEYVPGAVLNEPLPMTVYREDEFRHLGE